MNTEVASLQVNKGEMGWGRCQSQLPWRVFTWREDCGHHITDNSSTEPSNMQLDDTVQATCPYLGLFEQTIPARTKWT